MARNIMYTSILVIISSFFKVNINIISMPKRNDIGCTSVGSVISETNGSSVKKKKVFDKNFIYKHL